MAQFAAGLDESMSTLLSSLKYSFPRTRLSVFSTNASACNKFHDHESMVRHLFQLGQSKWSIWCTECSCDRGPRMKVELRVRVYLLVQGLQALNVTIGSCSTHERGKQRLAYLIHLLLVEGRVTLVLIILTSAVILV